MVSPFDALKPIAGRALETALNQALALDADARAALGKKATVEVVSVLPSAGGKMVFARLQHEVSM